MTGNLMGGGSNSGLDSITLYEHNHLVDNKGMKFKPKQRVASHNPTVYSQSASTVKRATTGIHRKAPSCSNDIEIL